MSLINVAVDRAEAMAIVNSNMRAFGFYVDHRPGLAGRVQIGDTLEFVGVDEAGKPESGPSLIRAVRAVLSSEEAPSVSVGAMLLLLDAPGVDDPNYAEAVERAQGSGGMPRLPGLGAMEEVMQKQLEALKDVSTMRERVAAFALQALVEKYGKGDAELHGAHVAQQALAWADHLIAALRAPKQA